MWKESHVKMLIWVRYIPSRWYSSSDCTVYIKCFLLQTYMHMYCQPTSLDMFTIHKHTLCIYKEAHNL